MILSKDSGLLTNAIQWILQNHIEGNAVPITHRNRIAYPEVTGYFIPTLLDIGEVDLAIQFARWLVTVQKPDGSFAGEDGIRTYVFDTGQVIRGWISIADRLPELMTPLQRACEWIVAGSDPQTGRFQTPAAGSDWSLGARGELSEGVHLYIIKPLMDAAVVLGKPEIEVAARKAMGYYLKNVQVSAFAQPNMLTHFFGYMQEALFELGYPDKAREGMASVAQYQQSNGGVPGYFDVPWICSTGLAQLAKVWYLLGDRSRADNALSFLSNFQNASGGLYGSYGVGANYFPADEISWAVKYAIDAELLRSFTMPSADLVDPVATVPALQVQPVAVVGSEGKTLESNLEPAEWHESITRGTTPELVAATVRKGAIPQWVTPILLETNPTDTVLELGSGTGELSAHLAQLGRITTLFDFSTECLNFASKVFHALDQTAQFIEGDVLQTLPFDDHAIDVIWSSGLLEHFTGLQIAHIVSESARVARKRVISLVPNAASLPYRLGKNAQERSGRWIWGKETPMATLEPVFRAAGLQSIREYSIAPEHALTFLDAPELANLRKELVDVYAALPIETLKELNQGYLLVTVGDVAIKAPVALPACEAKRLRRLVCIPNDPLEAYALAGYPDLTAYFNPNHAFDEVFCVSPFETHEYVMYGMKVIPTLAADFAARVQQLQADCVRAYDIPAAHIACATRLPNVPVICSVHDVNPARCPGPLPKADYFLSISGAVEHFLLEKGADPKRIFKFGNRVDMDIFRPMHDANRLAAFQRRYPGRYRVLLVGRRTEQKNLETLIGALALLGNEYTGIFVGQGDAKPYLALAEQHHIAERCHFIDAVPNHELAEYYSFSDCFCTPSRWEGFGIVFIEALASEALIVTSDIAPMNEFIHHGESGLLVQDYENPLALANTIRDAVQNQTLRAHIKSKARSAAEPFSTKNIATQERAIYEGVMRLQCAGAGAQATHASPTILASSIEIPTILNRPAAR